MARDSSGCRQLRNDHWRSFDITNHADDWQTGLRLRCPRSWTVRARHHCVGILGTTFTGCLVEETRVGPYNAVVPTLSGTAWITGFAQYVVDPEDPFPDGFTVGDIWGQA